jgi:small-conductance mechanosensitive channel
MWSVSVRQFTPNRFALGRELTGMAGLTAPSWVDWRLAAAAGALVGGWYLGRLLVRALGRRVARRFDRPSITRTVLRGVRTGAFLFGALVALNLLGLGLGDLVLSVTVFSAVLGLVLAPIIASVIDGLFVLADQPYEVGDMVEITDTGQRGFVEDITLRYTKLLTLQNTVLVVTNSSIRDRDVVNYSAEDERTRLSLSVTVTYEGDLDEARRTVESSARDADGVIDGGPDIRIGSARYPAPPTAYVDEFGDSGATITLRYWAREPYKLLTVRSRVQERVWDAIEATDDVEIAYPHTHHVFDDTSGEARVAVEGGRPGGPDRRDTGEGGPPPG